MKLLPSGDFNDGRNEFALMKNNFKSKQKKKKTNKTLKKSRAAKRVHNPDRTPNTNELKEKWKITMAFTFPVQVLFL